MKNVIFVFVLLVSACASSPFSGSNPFEHTELLLEAEEALGGVISDSGIPQALLAQTKAIVVFPNLVKAAVIAGARVGRGVVIVRSPKTGEWNPPAFIKSRQASWGIQAGIQQAELVLLVVTNKGLKQLFKRQYSLTEGPQIAVGPVGKTLDLNLDKLLNENDILAYSRIKGLFAGLSFEGTVISSDKNANYEYYQQAVSNRSLLSGQEDIEIPESGQAFLKRMNRLATPAGNEQ
ncbi:MAG: lipid-binding SYLF domain-containing protein [Nitrospinae bacterium]|nr:lipid-binding SYLF domain-containing protein [Nitrospinota bacterium]MBL7020141.1 lipid-binding SYLF domain-containing protein [Nitrospinaceae bacterium]